MLRKWWMGNIMMDQVYCSLKNFNFIPLFMNIVNILKRINKIYFLKILFIIICFQNNVHSLRHKKRHSNNLIEGKNESESYYLSKTSTFKQHNEEEYSISHCYSCASDIYRLYWSQLMHHYFPPKNFTDNCWIPDNSIGQIPCRTACFTLVEDTEDELSPKAILRGCVDRLLLFGMDDDVKDAIIIHHKNCRSTDRHLLQLISLSKDSQYVLMCTCEGKICNDEDMRPTLEMSSASKVMALSIIRYILLHISTMTIIKLIFSLL